MRAHFDSGSQSILSHYIEMVGGDLASLWEVGIDAAAPSISFAQMENFPLLLHEPGSGVPPPKRLYVVPFLNHLLSPAHKGDTFVPASYYVNYLACLHIELLLLYQEPQLSLSSITSHIYVSFTATLLRLLFQRHCCLLY